MSIDLKTAQSAMNQHGLAPFARLAAGMPRSMTGPGYAIWKERQTEVTERVKSRLEEHGATIVFTRDEVRIDFAGIKAMSRLGLYKALKNWNDKIINRQRRRPNTVAPAERKA